MATGYNISAQLLLQAPTNLAQVRQQVVQQLSGMTVPINVQLSPQAQATLQAMANQTATLANQTGALQGAATATATAMTSMGRAASGASTAMSGLSTASAAATRGLATTNQAVAQSTGFFTRLGEAANAAFQRFLAFSAGAGAFIAVTNGIRAGVRAGVDFETQMNRIQQVSGESAESIGAIRQKITELATGLGTSSADLAKSALVLAQTGLSAKEVAANLETLAQAAAAPNFSSMRETAEGMISVMHQFKTDADGTKEAIGAMNEVAAKFAVEGRDLVDAVRKSGGAFSAAGGDLHQFLALFTSIRQTTRESANEIATGLRTIFARAQRSDVIDQLKGIGVELRHTADEANSIGDKGLADKFVGPYEAVRRLSEAIKTIPSADPRFAEVVEALGGYRQVSRVIPLLQQFEVAEKALATAQTGSLSLYRSTEKAQETLATQVGKTKESFLELFRTLTSSRSFQQFATSALQLASGLAQILEYAKPLLPVLLALGTVKLANSVAGFFTNAATATPFAGRNKPFAVGGLVDGSPLRRFASGGPVGIVPGVGDTDSVPMNLPAGSFVIKKSSVKSIGADALNAMAMLTPGEAVVPPNVARRMGGGLLQRLNAGGKPHILTSNTAFPHRTLAELNSVSSQSVALPGLVSQLRQLTVGEAMALDNYSGEGAGLLNRYLRGDPTAARFAGKLEERKLLIDSAISSSSLDAESVLYRALLNPLPVNGQLGVPIGSKDAVGKIIGDAAYSSTTTSLDFLRSEFTNGIPDAAILKILARKGAPAVSMQGLSVFPEEQEILLGRNQRFRVVGQENGLTVVKQLARGGVARLEGGGTPAGWGSIGGVPARIVTAADQQAVRAYLRNIASRNNLNLAQYDAGLSLTGMFEEFPDLMAQANGVAQYKSYGQHGLFLNPNILAGSAEGLAPGTKYTAAHELGHVIDFAASSRFLRGSTVGGVRRPSTVVRESDTPLGQLIGLHGEAIENAIAGLPSRHPITPNRQSYVLNPTEVAADALSLILTGRVRQPATGEVRDINTPREFGDSLTGVLQFGRKEVIPYLRSRLGAYDPAAAYAAGGPVRLTGGGNVFRGISDLNAPSSANVGLSGVVKQLRALSRGEVAAIRDYAEGSGMINSRLRGTDLPSNLSPDDVAEYLADIKRRYGGRDQLDQVIKYLDSAVGSGTISGDISVFRGLVRSDAIERQLGAPLSSADAVGREFSDAGFLSTSVERGRTAAWSKSGLLQLMLKNGSPGIYLGNSLGGYGEVSRNHVEKEILLGRGSRFRILGRDSGLVVAQQLASGGPVRLTGGGQPVLSISKPYLLGEQSYFLKRFGTFKPNEPAQDYSVGNERVQQFRPITNAEFEALHQYTSDYYKVVNSLLRNDRMAQQLSIDGESNTFGGFDKSNSKDFLSLIASGVGSSLIKSPKPLFRAFSDYAPIESQLGISPRDARAVGRVFSDKAFSSTTINPIKPDSTGLSLKILPKIGARAAYLGEVSKFSSENEVLLDRNQQFKVVGHENGLVVVQQLARGGPVRLTDGGQPAKLHSLQEFAAHNLGNVQKLLDHLGVPLPLNRLLTGILPMSFPNSLELGLNGLGNQGIVISQSRPEIQAPVKAANYPGAEKKFTESGYSPLLGEAVYGFATRLLYGEGPARDGRLREGALAFNEATRQQNMMPHTFGSSLGLNFPGLAAGMKTYEYAGGNVAKLELMMLLDYLQEAVEPRRPTTDGSHLDSAVVKLINDKEAKFLSTRFSKGVLSTHEHQPVVVGGVPRFASGGSQRDTVPALLTPGEFIFNTEAVNRIGLPALHHMNKTGELPASVPGFNKGGYVAGMADGGIAKRHGQVTGRDGAVSPPYSLAQLQTMLFSAEIQKVVRAIASGQAQGRKLARVDVDDAAQEINLQLLKKLGTFDPSKGDFVGFVRGYGNQQVSDVIRKNLKQSGAGRLVEMPTDATTGRQVDYEDRGRTLKDVSELRRANRARLRREAAAALSADVTAALPQDAERLLALKNAELKSEAAALGAKLPAKASRESMLRAIMQARGASGGSQSAFPMPLTVLPNAIPLPLVAAPQTYSGRGVDLPTGFSVPRSTPSLGDLNRLAGAGGGGNVPPTPPVLPSPDQPDPGRQPYILPIGPNFSYGRSVTGLEKRIPIINPLTPPNLTQGLNAQQVLSQALGQPTQRPANTIVPLTGTVPSQPNAQQVLRQELARRAAVAVPTDAEASLYGRTERASRQDQRRRAALAQSPIPFASGSNPLLLDPPIPFAPATTASSVPTRNTLPLPVPVSSAGASGPVLIGYGGKRVVPTVNLPYGTNNLLPGYNSAVVPGITDPMSSTGPYPQTGAAQNARLVNSLRERGTPLPDLLTSRAMREVERNAARAGGPVADSTKQKWFDESVARQRAQVERELLSAQQRLLKLLYPSMDAELRLTKAKEDVAKALQGQKKVAFDANGSVLGTADEVRKAESQGLAPPGVAPRGWWGRLYDNTVGPVAGAVGGAASRFGRWSRNLDARAQMAGWNPGQAAFMASFGLPIVGAGLSGGDAEVAARSGNEGTYRTSNAAGGILTGVGTGALLGSMIPHFAVLGTAVGAIVGGLTGLVMSLRQTASDISSAKIGIAVQGLADKLSVVANLGVDAPAGYKQSILEDIGRAEGEISQKAYNESGYLWSSTSNYLAIADKERRQSIGQNVPGYTMLVRGELQRAARNRPGATAKDVYADFEADPANKEILGVLARTRRISIDKLRDELRPETQKFLNQARSDEGRQSALTTEANRVNAFGQLVQALQAASASLDKLRQTSATLAETFDGAYRNPSRISFPEGGLARLGDARNQPAFDLVRGFGGTEGANLANLGEDLNRVREAMPAIIAATVGGSRGEGELAIGAFGTTFEQLFQDRFGVGEKKELTPRLREIRTAAKAAIDQELSQGTRGIYQFGQAFKTDSTATIDRLLANQANPVVNFTRQANELYLAQQNEFADNAAAVARRGEAVGQGRDRVVELQTQLLRLRTEIEGQRRGAPLSALEGLPASALLEPFNARQKRLAAEGGIGGDGLNPDAIAGRLSTLTQDILKKETEQRAAFLNSKDGGAAFRAVTVELERLKSSGNALNQALRNLAESSQRVSVLQGKLSEIQGDKQARLGFGEQYLTSDYEERAKQAQGILLAAAARKSGKGLDGYSPEQASLALGTLGRLGSATLPGLGGVRADELRRQLIEASSDGQWKLAQGKADEEKSIQDQLLKAQQDAIKAQELQTNLQVAANDRLRTTMEQMPIRFAEELRQAFTRNEISRLESEQTVATTRQKRLARASEDAGYLRALGASKDSDVDLLVNNREDIDRSVSSVRNIVDRNRAFDEARANLEKYLRDAQQGRLPGESADKFNNRVLPQRGEELNRIINGVIAPNLTNEADRASIIENFSGEVAGGASFERRIGAIRRSIDKAQQNKAVVDPLATAAAEDAQRLRARLPGFDVNAVIRQGIAEPGRLWQSIDALKESGTTLGKLDDEAKKSAASVADLARRIAELRIGQLAVGKGAGEAVGGAAGAGENKAAGFATGGVVGMHPGKPRGTDTVPAWLTSGEMVVNRQSTQANRALLERINAARGPVYLANGGVFEESVFDALSDLAKLSDLTRGLGHADIDAQGFAPLLAEREGAVRSLLPRLGEDTLDILSGVGFSRLRRFGDVPLGMWGKDLRGAAHRVAPEFDNFVGPILQAAQVQGGNVLRPEAIKEPPQLLVERIGEPPREVPGRNYMRDALARRVGSLNLFRMRQLLAQSRNPFQNFGIGQADSAASTAVYDRALQGRENFLNRPSGKFTGTPEDYTADQILRRLLAKSPQRVGLPKNPPLRFATGGLVPHLAGGGFADTADRISSLLSPGEYVLPRSVVSSVGVPALDNLRRNPSVTAGTNGPGLSPEVAKAFETFRASSQTLGEAFKAFNTSASPLTSALNGFGSHASELAQALNSFSGQLQIVGTQRVEVTFLGAEVLARIQGELRTFVVDMLRQQLTRFVKNSLPDVQFDPDSLP